MRIVRIIKHRLHTLLHPSRADFDLEREIEIHLEQLVKERMAEGMSKSEALLAAKREFGTRRIRLRTLFQCSRHEYHRAKIHVHPAGLVE